MATFDYSGQVIDGRYRILHLLGKGGMGSVYLARHTVIGKKVAVKFLHAEFADNEEIVKRFYREAQTAAAIAHKNIIDVMDVGLSTQNEPYLVMEYLEGESLSSMLKRTGPVDLAAAAAIFEPVLAALASAHDKGVVHRDLKPENIFLVHVPGEQPVVKIIDFGISKIMGQGDQAQLTQTGMMLGTPAYMPPEQIRGEKNVDHRADIYAVGVILYELLTGCLPFNGETGHQILVSVLTEEPISPSTAYDGFPSEAEPLVMRLLSKHPDDRPQTALALLENVKALAAGESRAEHLSRYTSGMTHKTFAGGDLGGEAASGGEQVASDVLAGLIGNTTADRWSGTVARTKSRRGVYLAGAAFVALSAVGVSIWAFGERSTPAPATVPLLPASPQKVSEPPKPVAPQGVRIEVTGLPEDATIYLDRVKIPKNPFTVPLSKNMMQLKVAAPGYEDFLKWIEPSADQSIAATLSPVSSEDAADAVADNKAAKSANAPVKKTGGPAKRKPATKSAATPQRDAPTSPSEPLPKPTPKLRQGGRGTKFTEDFDD